MFKFKRIFLVLNLKGAATIFFSKVKLLRLGKSTVCLPLCKNNETLCSQKSKYSLIHSNSGLGDWGAILPLGFCMTSLTFISRRENVCYQLHVIAFAIMQKTICNYAKDNLQLCKLHSKDQLPF